MSKLLHTSTLVKLLLFGVLIAAVGFSTYRLVGLSEQYDVSLADLAACRSRIPQLTLLRKKPDRASRESRSEVALAKTIEESATRSGLKPAQVVSIEPQSPRRVADTPYEEFATLVRVEGVSLAELAKLATAIRELSSNTYPLQIAALRVAVPFHADKSQEKQIEAWNVELTLTYLVYSPKSRRS